MKLTKIKLYIFIFLMSLFWCKPLKITAQSNSQGEQMKAQVIEIIDYGQETFMDELVPFQNLRIKILNGSDKNKIIELTNSAADTGMTNVNFIEYAKGDNIIIYKNQDFQGETFYSIQGYEKKSSLIILTVLFLAVVIIVGRKWGLLSLIGLSISFIIIFKLIIPLIIKGTNPIVAVIIGALLIIPVTFYISHGFNKKTHVGVIATFIALLFTIGLAKLFVNNTHLTGFSSEEAAFLQVQKQGDIDIKNLMLAGIIIGALGILDDITIGQASAVKQLYQANNKLSALQLFIKGMKVGQDHISSMVNTLILVYAGSSLPLILLFFDSNRSFTQVLEYELIAEEIVRMLVGSIGLVLAAPLATFLAAYLYSSNKKHEKN